MTYGIIHFDGRTKYETTAGEKVTLAPIVEGRAASRRLTFKNPDGTPRDLTGIIAVMQIRKDYEDPVLVTLDNDTNGGIVLGGVAGTLDWSITATQAALLTVTPDQDEVRVPWQTDYIYEIKFLISAEPYTAAMGRLGVLAKVPAL